MSEKRTKFHYTFLKTFNIASIYEDDMIICKDFKLSWWIRLGLRKHYKEGGY